MIDTINATFKVTIGGVTRWVDCHSWDGGYRFWSDSNVALVRVGRPGSKLWPCGVVFFCKPDGSYTQSESANALNRRGPIVAWNDAEFSRHLSEHNSARR